MQGALLHEYVCLRTTYNDRPCREKARPRSKREPASYSDRDPALGGLSKGNLLSRRILVRSLAVRQLTGSSLVAVLAEDPGGFLLDRNPNHLSQIDAVQAIEFRDLADEDALLVEHFDYFGCLFAVEQVVAA